MTKIPLQQKIRVSKNRKTLKGLTAIKKRKELKKKPKSKPKKSKTIWPELNPRITCFLCNLVSIVHISLFLTSNCKPFEVF